MGNSYKNITDLIPSLIKNVERLEQQRENIARQWIHNPLVLNILKKHDISPLFFIDEYAAKVLEYFFGVVKKEKVVGVCPVIDQLLLYLKERDVSADELFILCTHARKAVIDETFTQKIASHRLISEVSLLFDLNFSGVLKQYTRTIYRLEKQVQEELAKNREKDLLLFQQSRLATMGEMISMIAHQWRQPLGAIAANAIDMKMKSELKQFDLQEEKGCAAYQEYINNGLDEIENLVQNLTRTIDDFRNFNKPDKISVPMSFEEVCNKALNIIRVSLENDNIEIIYRFHSDKKHDLYDSEMMQVILNILKNAQDNFREKGTKNPRIVITTNDDTVSICDNGGGIEEAITEKIFDPYFSTKDEKNGTGLGLYMSKSIVEEHHHGKLHVSYGEGGACFTISLMEKEA